MSKHIVETKKITDVLQYVKPDSFVIFDIDNTLITSVQEFGFQAYFSYTVERFMQQGFSKADAIKKSSEAFVAIQNQIDSKWKITSSTQKIKFFLLNHSLIRIRLVSIKYQKPVVFFLKNL